MITNEQFLQESKKLLSNKVNLDSLNVFLKLVEDFQEQRLERLLAPVSVQNDLFAEFLSPALNEVMENQNSKQEKFFFESTAQHYTNSALIALKLKLQKEVVSGTELEKEDYELVKHTAFEEIEKLLNTEKKNGHKFHTVIHDYIKDSQEFLYDHGKLALKGRSQPSIAERVKEIQKNKEDKKFNAQELEHPKLEAQQFEREMKLLLTGEISENQINSALKRVEDFQLGFVGALKKKINNPTGASDKLLPNVPENDQLKALKDWAWEEESANVMGKVLKIIKKSSPHNITPASLENLNTMSEGLESIMLDIGSLKKYNEVVKISLLDSLDSLKVNLKKTTTLKM